MAQKKEFDALIATQKNLTFCKLPFLTNQENLKRLQLKKKLFLHFLLIFYRNGTLTNNKSKSVNILPKYAG